ncbi:hypothetical protein F511_04962 [Dorcoceras hygrometricum]|uniref:C2H2-type domain-containing protein n=1 Tax=Dorcoceras hygrometricum TaxID=472368 RepID=A0A2Z7BN18_9LAMI|nr:hypothetical protein F511_04962 [Dorcoceras hygrometricum]
MEHHTAPNYSMRNPSSFQELVIWPPRFYSCCFCRREFRSSQALGGHMNVHRRDRAKLKQQHSPTPSPPDQTSRLQKDSDYFRGLQMFPSFVSAGEHEMIPRPLFHARESFQETAVSCKRIRKSDRNLPCLCRDLFANCKKISGSMEDVDLELRLGPNPPTRR